MVEIPNKPSFRPGEVGKIFGVCRQTVYNWIENGRILGAVRIKGMRPLRIPRKSLIEMQERVDPEEG